MKKLSETMQIGIAVVGLAIAYATFSSKKGEGGTGGGAGGLDIPFIPDLSGFFGTAPAPAPADVVAGQPVISGASLRSFVESSLQLNPDTYAATGKKTYSGQRTVGDTTYFVEGNTDIAGNQLNKQTGQLFSQLTTGERLYSEKSTKDLPAISKKSEPVFKNTMGGSSSNKGGTWVGSTFYQGKYT